VLFYGEEIGLGENLDIDGRESVRTPMQWTGEATAGFSPAPPSRLRRPLPEGRFGPLAVNVAEQERDPNSLLNWMERVVRRRRESPEIGWGSWRVLDVGDDAVLAHRCDWEGRSFVAVHNFSPEPREVRVPLDEPSDDAADPADDPREREVFDLLSSNGSLAPVDNARLPLTLEAYGYRWLRVRREGDR
jgi:glycosidase